MTQNYSGLLEKSLEGSRLELLHLLAHQASMLQTPIYIVGGVVRDILLGRSVKEFDLVLEGDSGQFAEYVVKKFGGRVMIHSKFRTATWEINESTLKRLEFPGLSLSEFAFSFDLISARTETYKAPGALPTVKRSTIEDDLRRRDFTINAMAIRIDGNHFGELVDVLSGQADLEWGLIRVIHPKSFIDDPTRMFRAVRYAERYDFKIEPGTLSLFNDEAKSTLRELSGERIRHEFDLLFEEEKSVVMLRRLEELGLSMSVNRSLAGLNFQRLTKAVNEPEKGLGEFAIPDILTFRQALSWVLVLMDLDAKDLDFLSTRLAFPSLLTKAVHAASALQKNISGHDGWRPSQWTLFLDELPALSVYAMWLDEEVLPLYDYLANWQKIKPVITGEELISLGLIPGPRYKEILTRLRVAWLDGEVNSPSEEKRLLQKLLAPRI